MPAICIFGAMKTKRKTSHRRNARSGYRHRSHSGRKKQWHKLWFIPLAILLFALLVVGYAYRQVAYVPAVIGNDTTQLYVKDGFSLGDAFEQLAQKAMLRNPRIANRYIQHRGRQIKIESGRYLLLPDMSMQEIANLLISGGETPVSLTLRGLRTKQEVLQFFATYLAVTEEELDEALSDPALCRQLGGFDTENIRCLFLPGDYTFSWNVSVDELLDVMQQRYRDFWTAERRALADSLGLSPTQVAIIASIVEEESQKSDEHARIARLYLNRFHRGMKLQADPTVKFATGRFDLKRITSEHLSVRSAYNTYREEGLPPGPIRLPRASTMDSVLHSHPSNDLYMCAKEDFSGYHNFATTYTAHQANARKYQAELNRRGIK